MKIQIEVQGKDLDAWEEPLDLARVATEVHKERCEDTNMDIVLKGEADMDTVAVVSLIAGSNGFYMVSSKVGEQTIALEFRKRVPSQIAF